MIVWHLDRLYRKPRELEQLLDLLDVCPIRVESAQGGSFDLNRHEGRLFARQLVAFANYESAHKGARVSRAQQQRATAWWPPLRLLAERGAPSAREQSSPPHGR